MISKNDLFQQPRAASGINTSGVGMLTPNYLFGSSGHKKFESATQFSHLSDPRALGSQRLAYLAHNYETSTGRTYQEAKVLVSGAKLDQQRYQLSIFNPYTDARFAPPEFYDLAEQGLHGNQKPSRFFSENKIPVSEEIRDEGDSIFTGRSTMQSSGHRSYMVNGVLQDTPLNRKSASERTKMNTEEPMQEKETDAAGAGLTDAGKNQLDRVVFKTGF